ncbi:MAG: GGDEF domain-containing protein [Erysipelotrichaceae bacterium]|nr:GGDEF domain-containing protein [Erysipelotrichaceae bacterium]
MAYTKEDLKIFSFFDDKNISATLDFLTGVVNRENIVNLVRDFVDIRIPFTLYLLDIDNFKIVNDESGHQVGDMLLRQIANELISITKGKAIVGRYGGDEFIIISLDTIDYQSTWDFSKLILNHIRTKKISIVDDNYITMTLGAVAYPNNALHYDELMLKADKALYRGKKKGRNCFIIYDEEKHKDIDISSKSEIMSDMVDHVYRLLVEKNDLQYRISDACGYFNNIYGISFYYLNNEGKIYTLANKTDIKINDLDVSILKPVFNDKESFAINNYSYIKDKYPEFHEYCWDNKVMAIIVEKLYSYNTHYGYLLIVDHNIKRVWQKDDKILFSFFSKLIGLVLNNEKK